MINIHYADATPRILIACSDNQFTKWSKEPFIGRLVIPPMVTNTAHTFMGMDNYAYTDWNPKKFVETLIRSRDNNIPLRWVCAPDVVGDWQETYIRYNIWKDVINGFNFDIAYVIQDEQPISRIPWSDIRTVFIGGSTQYKLSQDAYKICTTAIDYGKYVHIGRVNSIKRIRRFLDVADSFDGMSFSRYRDVKIPKVLRYLRNVYIRRYML